MTSQVNCPLPLGPIRVVGGTLKKLFPSVWIFICIYKRVCFIIIIIIFILFIYFFFLLLLLLFFSFVHILFIVFTYVDWIVCYLVSTLRDRCSLYISITSGVNCTRCSKIHIFISSLPAVYSYLCFYYSVLEKFHAFILLYFLYYICIYYYFLLFLYFIFIFYDTCIWTDIALSIK